jgi:glycosyltransferase involved in cell wall biosynthesis
MKPVCVVSCPIDTFSGYGARSRDFVKALIIAKGEEWDIKILSQRWGATPYGYLDKKGDLYKRIIPELPKQQPEIWMQITVPNEFQPVGKFNVGITAGIESNVYPPQFVEGSNRMNLNFVSSKFSAENLQKVAFEKKEEKTNKVVGQLKSEKPVEVMFEGLDLNKYFKKPQNSGLLKDVKEEFCFLHTGHWLPGAMGEDRKNTGLMIKTFLETFSGSGRKKPALVMKCNSVDYSLMDKYDMVKRINQIKKDVKGKLPNIYLVHGEMTDDEMNKLNNDNKVKAFISFTKGEGFGRPLLEAAITGKPTIVSNWSGHVDFIHPDYNILIGGELKPVHKSTKNEFLLPESQWFNINTEIAGRAIKDVFKNYKKYWESSRKQTQYIKDNWSFDKMTEKLKLIMDQVKFEAAPSQIPLNLPKLKKVGDKKQELPKLKLPKLKKIKQ